MDHLPTPDEFPDQPDLAVKVCPAVRADLARRDPPLNYMQSLRYFAREADSACLALPFKYATILAWVDQVNELINWYHAMVKEPGDAHRGLLYRARELARAEFCQNAPCAQVVEISYIQGRAEEVYGTLEGALAVYRWCLDEIVAKEDATPVQKIVDLIKKRAKLVADILADSTFLEAAGKAEAEAPTTTSAGMQEQQPGRGEERSR